METLFLTSMALGLLLPLGLYVLGASHVRKAYSGRAEIADSVEIEPPLGTPRVGLVVPLTGNAPGMHSCLESLLRQSYPNYEVVFVTRDLEDPATQVVNDVVSTTRNARHVLSSAASRCSQKNHNLLAGIAALGPSVEILTFCDSTHLAPPHFLSDLVAPILRGEAVMTTGFHRIIPQDFRLPTLGMLLSVLAIHLMQAIALLSQPWGGAMAIPRKTFEDHGIDLVWGRNVVDDMSMGAHLQKAAIRVLPVSSACLETPLSGQTLANWQAWLTRQLYFLKFCQPLIWIASALVAYLFAAPTLLAVLSCLGGALGIVPASMALAGCTFLVIFTLLGIMWRSLVPEKIPLGPWIAALVAANLMVASCYCKTWLSNVLSWRGISYRVTWGGKVREVIGGE